MALFALLQALLNATLPGCCEMAPTAYVNITATECAEAMEGVSAGF